MMVAGFVTKTVFCAVLSMESVVLNLTNERQANEARRQLLRYVFHEVRVVYSCACAPFHHVSSRPVHPYRRLLCLISLSPVSVCLLARCGCRSTR